MTSKTTKTILFAGLIMTLMIPITGINVAHAVQTDQIDAEEIAKNAQKIGIFKQKALKDGDIPDTELLKRYGSEWASQYESVEKFEENQKGVESYVNDQHQNNGWNQAMVKAYKKIHNFETIIGKVGHGHEITLLVAEKHKLQGDYNPPEQVRKYHEWIAKQYSTPNTIQEIDDKLVSIMGDQKFIKLSEKIAEQFDNLAKHGNVPNELIQQDVEYWVTVVNVSVCQYDKNCDLSTMQKILENESHRTKNIIVPTLDVLGHFLPEVYAITNQPHYGTIVGTPYTCDYGTCALTLSAGPYSDAFVLTKSDPPYPYHSIGTTMHVYASTCPQFGGTTSKVIGNLYVGTQTFPFSKQTIGGCAISDVVYTVANNPTATWHWTIQSTHSAWS